MFETNLNHNDIIMNKGLVFGKFERTATRALKIKSIQKCIEKDASVPATEK